MKVAILVLSSLAATLAGPQFYAYNRFTMMVMMMVIMMMMRMMMVMMMMMMMLSALPTH